MDSIKSKDFRRGLEIYSNYGTPCSTIYRYVYISLLQTRDDDRTMRARLDFINNSTKKLAERTMDDLSKEARALREFSNGKDSKDLTGKKGYLYFQIVLMNAK